MNLQPINNIATQIQIILGLELLALKRNASGALTNSLSHQITPSGEFGFNMQIMGLDYWRVVEYGVNANNIPFDATTRSGAQNSQYIAGLMKWIQDKGISSDNDVIRGMAFAIATKQTATSRGGFGLGNPIDKQKLGFVRKSQPKINKELEKITQIYQSEVVKIIGDTFQPNIQIII
jgi:hypothetical protein